MKEATAAQLTVEETEAEFASAMSSWKEAEFFQSIVSALEPPPEAETSKVQTTPNLKRSSWRFLYVLRF